MNAQSFVDLPSVAIVVGRIVPRGCELRGWGT